MKSTPCMVLQCKFIFKRFVECETLRLFGIEEEMRVMISFLNIPNEFLKKVNKKINILKTDEPLSFGKDGKYSTVWKDYYSCDLIKT